jgi:two-component system phosphate regulon sensor histidine kinase PhoR
MRKPLIIFYFLFFYATAQLIWWGILLVKAIPEQKTMIIGEGIFFMIIFIFGALRLKTAFVREHNMQKQQHNFMLAVTHELKSPLASIKLYIQTILKRDLNKEQQHQFLSNSLKDIERLDDLVENVLIATKLENIRAHFPKERFNFSQLVENIANRLQINACSHQVIKTSIEPEVYLEGDKFALTNVVTNLIENAIKYSPDCAQVDVFVQKVGEHIQFSVLDQGNGIEDEEKKRIFNKYKDEKGHWLRIVHC